MAKKRKPAAGAAASTDRATGRGSRGRLARLEKRLARLAKEEARRARQLEEVRAKQAEVRARIAELDTAAMVGAPVDSAGPSPDAAAPQAYCMREKRKVAIADAELVVLRNGRRAYAGTCPSCGARVVAIIGAAAAG